MLSIDRARLRGALHTEEQRFIAEHPRSAELFRRAKGSLLGGVPMNWMVRWAGAFPVFVREASGAHFTDVDGRSYLDLCLGDTGAMTGHAPPATVEAIAAQARRGLTFMLPT
nr:aminotransferase class III-fold pyridoxal phosphate-dependent enzyme [Chloroflexota bacterium]